jgi:hypothetical protein
LGVKEWQKTTIPANKTTNHDICTAKNHQKKQTSKKPT